LFEIAGALLGNWCALAYFSTVWAASLWVLVLRCVIGVCSLRAVARLFLCEFSIYREGSWLRACCSCVDRVC